MKESVLHTKSFTFSLEIVKVYKKLKEEEKEYVLSKQLLRSATAVGALLKEAEYAQSHADFINKLSIALKEENESLYWLELLQASGVSFRRRISPYSTLNKEIIKMRVKSITTLKAKK